MKANCWIGPNHVEVQDVPDPVILNDRDAIVKITSSAICGSDLHLLDGYVPTMQKGDIMGHEFMGEVVEVGRGVNRDKLRVGDRVVVPFPIACGACAACRAELYSCCENSNPNAWLAEKFFGHPVAGIFGYSHLTGGFAGGQAAVRAGAVRRRRPDEDRVRICATSRCCSCPTSSPPAYMGAEMCEHHAGGRGRGVGRGPGRAVRHGQRAGCSGRRRSSPSTRSRTGWTWRPRPATSRSTSSRMTCGPTLLEMTGGRGPDKCIDAVGMEAAHGSTPIFAYDRAKQAARLETDRPFALRQAIMACRNGGIVSVIGVYGGLVDKFPVGAFMNRALTMRTGQCHVQRYMQPLLQRIEGGEIDPSFDHHPHAPTAAGAARLRHLQAQAGRLREDRAQALRQSCRSSCSIPTVDGAGGGHAVPVLRSRSRRP